MSVYDGMMSRKEMMDLTSPETSPERLMELFELFPIEVALNPNLPPLHLKVILAKLPIRNLSYSKEYMAKISFATLWSLLENPALELLALENPSDPIHQSLNGTMLDVRFASAREQLADNSKAGSAFCEAAWSFMEFIKTFYSMESYLLWLYFLSGVWHSAHSIPVPPRYRFQRNSHPRRETIPLARNRHLVAILSGALNLASSKAWPRAFGELWELAEEMYDGFGMDDHELEMKAKAHIVSCMEKAESGRLWPDPTLGEIDLLEILMAEEKGSPR